MASALDASALMAVVLNEPGADVVIRELREAIIGAVNLSEVVAKLVDRGGTEEAIRHRMELLSLDVRPFDAELAYQAGLLRMATRHRGLSFGDRACLALGRREDVPVLTAERAWADLDVGVRIVVIR